jgi:hypothetical protein
MARTFPPFRRLYIKPLPLPRDMEPLSGGDWYSPTAPSSPVFSPLQASPSLYNGESDLFTTSLNSQGLEGARFDDGDAWTRSLAWDAEISGPDMEFAAFLEKSEKGVIASTVADDTDKNQDAIETTLCTEKRKRYDMGSPVCATSYGSVKRFCTGEGTEEDPIVLE